MFPSPQNLLNEINQFWARVHRIISIWVCHDFSVKKKTSRNFFPLNFSLNENGKRATMGPSLAVVSKYNFEKKVAFLAILGGKMAVRMDAVAGYSFFQSIV